MKNVQLWLAVGLLGLTLACSRGMKDKLFGTEDSSTASETETGTPTAFSSSVDDQLMAKVAADISNDLMGTGQGSFAAPFAAACVPGEIKISSNSVTYPPQVFGSSRTYTVNGVNYFSGNYYQSSGGTLVFIKEMNGTCLKNSSIYGKLAVQGSSYTQWASAGTQTQYRYYYYKYNYNYKGDILEIEGEYTIGSETGTTVYPIKFTINI
jgi:hypothetical protein